MGMAKKTKATNDIIKKSDKDLAELLVASYKTLGNARFGAAGSRAGNTPEGRMAKKTIARVKTELRRREDNDTK